MPENGDSNNGEKISKAKHYYELLKGEIKGINKNDEKQEKLLEQLIKDSKEYNGRIKVLEDRTENNETSITKIHKNGNNHHHYKRSKKEKVILVGGGAGAGTLGLYGFFELVAKIIQLFNGGG